MDSFYVVSVVAWNSFIVSFFEKLFTLSLVADTIRNQYNLNTANNLMV